MKGKALLIKRNLIIISVIGIVGLFFLFFTQESKEELEDTFYEKVEEESYLEEGISNTELEDVPSDSHPIVEAVRKQIGVTVRYDSSYVVLDYPLGDVPIKGGVCTDVLIRALRSAYGIDLQALVHEDMKVAFNEYPNQWGLQSPDRNIDHRRVLNLMTYFNRKGYSIDISNNPDNYLPGDIVTCIIPGNLPHLMIVSDRKTEAGVPYIIHNIGAGTREEDRLFEFQITGHYRIKNLD